MILQLGISAGLTGMSIAAGLGLATVHDFTYGESQVNALAMVTPIEIVLDEPGPFDTLVDTGPVALTVLAVPVAPIPESLPDIMPGGSTQPIVTASVSGDESFGQYAPVSSPNPAVSAEQVMREQVAAGGQSEAPMPVIEVTKGTTSLPVEYLPVPSGTPTVPGPQIESPWLMGVFR